jgi:predicted RNase H-like HicB family nuclease
MRVVTVKATFDSEAGVWYVEESDLEGVNAEAASFDELLAKLPGVIADLLEEDDDCGAEDGVRVPIELVAHAHTRVRMASARP